MQTVWKSPNCSPFPFSQDLILSALFSLLVEMLRTDIQGRRFYIMPGQQGATVIKYAFLRPSELSSYTPLTTPNSAQNPSRNLSLTVIHCLPPQRMWHEFLLCTWPHRSSWTDLHLPLDHELPKMMSPTPCTNKATVQSLRYIGKLITLLN